MRPFEEATAKCAAIWQEMQQNRMAAAASSYTHDQAVPLRFFTNMGEATAKAADVVQEIEQNRMAAAASSHTQETVTSETETQLVMVEGAVPDLDLLTLQQQALDAVAAAPEVRGLLLKILKPAQSSANGDLWCVELAPANSDSDTLDTDLRAWSRRRRRKIVPHRDGRRV